MWARLAKVLDGLYLVALAYMLVIFAVWLYGWVTKIPVGLVLPEPWSTAAAMVMGTFFLAAQVAAVVARLLRKDGRLAAMKARPL